MKARTIYLALAMMFVACTVGSAVAFQRETGLQTVSGTIVDTNGKPVPNVKVVLTSVKKKSDRTAKTDKSGYFHFEFVPVGEYSIRVDDPGYESSSIHLQVSTYAEATIRLKVSARTPQGQPSDAAKH
jgi:uncharacterized membrane protein